MLLFLSIGIDSTSVACVIGACGFCCFVITCVTGDVSVEVVDDGVSIVDDDPD